MKSQGFFRYALNAIEYDAQDIAERQKTARVVELAASRKALQINPITIAQGGLLVAGRDRLAADLLNGESAVWAHVVAECSEADLLRIEVEENVRRRDIDRDVQLARLVAETTKEKASKAPGNSGKPGRPVTPRGQARAEVAKVAGTTPEAVRRAETRAAAKAEPPKAVEVRTFLADYGVGVDMDLDAEAARVAGHLSTAARELARAQAAFTAATEALEQLYGADGQAHYTFAKPMLADAARLREQTHALAAAARGKVPLSLCAYGKGGCTASCNACRGLKWSTADHSAAIPAELLREGADAMVSNGKGGTVPFDHNKGETNERTIRNRAGSAGDAQRQPRGARRVERKGDVAGVPAGIPGRHPDQRQHGEGDGAARGNGDALPAVRDDADGGRGVRAVAVQPDGPTRGGLGGRGVTHTEGMGPADVAPIRPKKGPPRMQVELADGRVVDPTNPPEDIRYSGDDAPAEDLPELEVDRDEAIEWADDDGEAA
jgi:hypothetical protein